MRERKNVFVLLAQRGTNESVLVLRMIWILKYFSQRSGLSTIVLVLSHQTNLSPIMYSLYITTGRTT